MFHNILELKEANNIAVDNQINYQLDMVDEKLRGERPQQEFFKLIQISKYYAMNIMNITYVVHCTHHSPEG